MVAALDLYIPVSTPIRPHFEIVRKDGWIPERIAAKIRQANPQSRLWEIVRDCLQYLPLEQAEELIDRITSTVVVESSLALTVIRYDGRIENLGIVSRKVVTTAGVNYLAGGFNAGANNVGIFKYHGIGTTNTAEASGDTALAAESTTALNPDSTRATGSQANSTNTYTTVGTNTVDASVAAVEHGLFTQAATGGGTLWDRSVFSTVNLASGDSLQSTYVLTLSAGG